ncbi:MAG TPA: thioredoxin domain-containing protein [Burkholderiales bacterium]|nr:thioredoxin domain-containing protein [Burkholderiales bacterium]
MNHLAHETSPYLLQHADNPVEWYAWGEEALKLARSQDKPILLSIGYSACHWCHVMAHESFEDPEVAAEMNRHFINIKVDREERPDLDQIYQLSHAMLTQRGGGWPLTMFLAPDGTPFFGGTYFPKHARYGMPGFLELLPKVADAYRDKRADIVKQNASLLEALNRTLPTAGSGTVPERAPLEAAIREFAQVFDDVHGGIGQAPKFPHPSELAFCLRRHALDGGELSLAIARLTLTKMAEGGIYDHIGGGFSRYSVDQYWSIPHFEKMLYDNAALLALYSDAWLVTGQPAFESVVRETVQWVMREMQSPEGGFYSSLDADSEHEEGKFYVWTPAEVREVLAPEEYAAVEPYYGLDGAPNFEGKQWHFRVMKPLAAVAKALAVSPAECAARLASARSKLLAARERRVRPGRDEKVLTSWNAMMVKGLARAARVFGEAGWLESARRAVDFLRTNLWRERRLFATYKDGVTHLNAYLDDHALLLEALLELLQAEFQPRDLTFARDLAEILLDRFEDGQEGGFFFVSHDHEHLIHRAKPGQDSATPSGNGIAAFALQRLGHLVGEPRYLAAAERAVKLYYPAMERQASGFVSLAAALEEYLAPLQLVILRGERSGIMHWQRALARGYRPATLIVGIARDIDGLPAALDKPAPPTESASPVNAWVCRGVTCLPPIADLGELERELADKQRGPL